jgi:hypothetical protein
MSGESVEEKIDVQQAYAAMFYFIETYYNRGPNDELAMMLGSMALWSDGRPGDNALWNDWLNAIERARTDREGVKFQIMKKE